ncbi:MAG: hypothetical protein IIV78_07385 [Oscillospiraceae bacterium]|nr:hypothetical protein [Oscillospiraceae bacterium]
MDKKKRRIDRLQNLAIALLSVSAVVMLLQTPLFGNLGENPLPSWLSGTASSAHTGLDEELISPAPVQLMLSNSFVRFGADTSTADPLFEAPGAFLGEAIGSAQAGAQVSDGEFLEHLLLPGLYFDFYSELPLELLSGRLGASISTNGDVSARRCLLSPLGDSVALYVQGESGFRRFACAVSASALTEYLDMQEGNGAEFAAVLGEHYEHLAPYTVLPAEMQARKKLIAGNPLADFDNTDFLSRAEFNPHTQDRYAESSGTLVILEGQRILRLQNNGTAIYSGSEAEVGSLYRVSSAERATRSEAVAGARNLLAALLSGHLGEASLFLHSVEETESGFRLFFDYAVDGTSVRFSDGTHAADVSVSGNSITEFSIHCRRYQKTESDSLLLPTEQAAAVSRIYGGGELSVAYIDAFGESISADWVIN